jgi:hypothetical protein
MTEAANTTAKKIRGKPFQKGQVGNPKGRPKGSRNKLSEDFIGELAAKFEEQGPAAIDRVIEENPAKFLQLVADLIPKDFNVKHDAGDAFLQLWQGMAGGKPKGD